MSIAARSTVACHDCQRTDLDPAEGTQELTPNTNNTTQGHAHVLLVVLLKLCDGHILQVCDAHVVYPYPWRAHSATEGTFLKASDHSLIDIFWIESAWPSANPDACVCA